MLEQLKVFQKIRKLSYDNNISTPRPCGLGVLRHQLDFFLFIDSSYIDAGIELAYHGY